MSANLDHASTSLAQPLATLRFFLGERGDTVARYNGKICLIGRAYAGRRPLPEESWVCAIDADEGRFFRVRPLQPVAGVRYGWYPTDRVALGVPELDWLPVEPLIRAMGYSAPRCPSPPHSNEQWAANAPYRAAKELSDRLDRGGPVYEILPVLGWPDAVEGTGSEWVMLVWQHPTYGELRYRGWIGADRRDSFSRVPWRIRREYARSWPMTWTGEIRMRQEYGPPTVMGELRLRAWPDVTVWTIVGTQHGVYPCCPPNLVDRVRAILGAGAKPLAAYQQEYANALAQWAPWRYIWRRALWLADENGAHSKVLRLRTSWKGSTPRYESPDGAERGGGECVYHSVADTAVTGYLQSAGGSAFGGWSSNPRGPDVPSESVFPDTRGYMYGWYPYQDTALVLRQEIAESRVPDTSGWPDYPRHPQGTTWGDAELYGHPTGDAREQVLAEAPEPPHLPGVAQEIAHTSEELEAHRAVLTGLRDQRLAEVEAQVQALAVQIRDVFTADLEWTAARTALVAARVQAEGLLRSVRGVTLPEGLMVTAPERARGFDASSLRAEAEEMSTRAAGLRDQVERAIAAHRLPALKAQPASVRQPTGEPAPWTCDGIEPEQVTSRIGVPTGIGVSGLLLANGQAEPGAYPVVAIARPFAGGKRWSRSIINAQGLRPLIDERQGRVSGSPYSSPLAIFLVCAVTDLSWAVTIETTKDGAVVDVETLRGGPSSAGCAVFPSAPSTVDDLRRKWGNQ